MLNNTILNNFNILNNKYFCSDKENGEEDE